MTIRPLVILPDPVLRLGSEPVGPITGEIRTLVADMFETMYDAPGVGLAAIQIGVAKRVVTIDTSKEEGVRDARVFINPEIVWSSEERRVYDEGCLSIPDYYAEVERPDRVRVRFRDIDGNEQEIEADGLLSTCIQHEIDHLSKLKRDRVIKKFTKAAKRDAA
jgi:peptide deformylase